MLSLKFEKHLSGFDLQPEFISEEAVTVLFGPSGAGKSLTLRAIAGLLRPDRGRIVLPQGVVFDSEAAIDLPPQRRDVGYLVQDLALFPHLTVAANLGFAIERWPRRQAQTRIDELIALLGLQGLSGRYPRSLSGGQQQRVALGRALAARPALLLLDEPFGPLDSSLRMELRGEVMRLSRLDGVNVVYVSHDLDEAFSVGGVIAVYDQGKVLQWGTRDDVFGRPSSKRVAELLEMGNFLPGVVGSLDGDVAEVESPFFQARARVSSPLKVGDEVSVCVRPQHLQLLPAGAVINTQDSVLAIEVVKAERGLSGWRLQARLRHEAAPPQLSLQVQVSDREYKSLAIAGRRDWRLVLPLAATVAVPR